MFGLVSKKKMHPDIETDGSVPGCCVIVIVTGFFGVDVSDATVNTESGAEIEIFQHKNIHTDSEGNSNIYFVEKIFGAGKAGISRPRISFIIHGTAIEEIIDFSTV